MPKQATVTLGGRQYTVREKPMGQTRQWRTRLQNSRVMRVMQAMDMEVAGSLQGLDVKAALGFGLLRALPAVSEGLAGAVDEIIDLLFDYVPELKADEEWLSENAYDEEAIAAFIEVLKLNFPIMALWATVSGSRVQSTATRSDSANGASGLPASGPPKKVSISS